MSAGVSVRGETSKAAFEVITAAKSGIIATYGSDGKEVAAPPVGSYFARVDSRSAGGATTGSSMFTMRNTGPRVASIRRLYLMFSSNATAAVASSLVFGVTRFYGATLPSAGTVIDAIKKRSTYPPACVSDIRTGGTGNVVTANTLMEGDFLELSCPRSLGGVQVMDIDFGPAGSERYAPFDLQPLEGLALVVRVQTNIAGDTLTGHIEWDERL
jgi:hypothetical protein